MPRKVSRNQSESTHQSGLNNRWICTEDSSALYFETGKALIQMPDQRVTGLASEDLCKFPSLCQALVRCFVAAVLLCTFLKLFLRRQVFQDRCLLRLKYDRTASFQCSMRANKNKKHLKI